jgi:hypothetical protein
LGSNSATSKCSTPFHSLVATVGVGVTRLALLGNPSLACQTNNSSLLGEPERATTRTELAVNAPPFEKKKKKKVGTFFFFFQFLIFFRFL